MSWGHIILKLSFLQPTHFSWDQIYYVMYLLLFIFIYYLCYFIPSQFTTKHFFLHLDKKKSGTLRLRDFSFFLSSMFIYEPILIKICMTSEVNTHKKITKGQLKISDNLFLHYMFLSTPNLLKTFQECQMSISWRHKFFMKWSTTSKVIQSW